MEKLIKLCTALISAAAMAVMGTVAYYDVNLPDKYYTHDGKVKINSAVYACSDDSEAVTAAGVYSTSLDTDIKLLGIFPVKSAQVEQVEEKLIVPCGNPFGIKLNTDGVLVVGMGEVKTDSGMCCPAKEAGFEEGDAILTAGGETVYTNEDMEKIVKNSSGAIEFTIRRDDEKSTVEVQPAIDQNGVRRVGLWVRDSSAGIGTITYYDPETSQFGGLGHPICDVDTGEIMPLLTGQVVKVVINDVVKGYAGDPGELKGSFASSKDSGTISENNETGVFGTLYSNPSLNAAIPVALKQEITEGAAQIYTTISGTTPQVYDIEIEKVNISDTGKTKNMIIKVTDSELLEKTGGIVQGMSGSPIVQNGKLVGAVTHVLVNDPQRGYGIFIENMYAE